MKTAATFNRPILLLIIMISVAFSPPGFAEQTAEIYETYLPAPKLVPVIEPILNPDDRITAYHNKLFIKANEETHREILALLAQVDRLPQNILISVRYSEDSDSAQATTNEQIKVFRGTSRDSDVEVELMAKQRLSTRLDKADQKIKVLEGEQGILNVGKEAAETKWVLVNPFETRVTQEYKTVGSQLYVIPYLLKDDRVRLEVFTKNQQFRGGSETKTKKMEAQTVLLLEPGVWTPMAGSVQVSNDSRNSNTRNTHSDRTSSKTLQIKVDVLE